MQPTGMRFVAIASLAALAFAACSSSAKPASSPTTTATAATTTTTAAPSEHPGSPTVALVSHGSFGKIMVDGNGRTLYEDENDKPGKPACTAVCLAAWPAVAAPASPTYGPGLSASTFSVVTAADGTKQLAADGFPLYTFVNDAEPGDAKGQDVNGFYTVLADGKRYDPGAAAG
jgi:predicted lipoprotein with Yx(FWY)xxD motif